MLYEKCLFKVPDKNLNFEMIQNCPDPKISTKIFKKYIEFLASKNDILNKEKIKIISKIKKYIMPKIQLEGSKKSIDGTKIVNRILDLYKIHFRDFENSKVASELAL